MQQQWNTASKSQQNMCSNTMARPQNWEVFTVVQKTLRWYTSSMRLVMGVGGHSLTPSLGSAAMQQKGISSPALVAALLAPPPALLKLPLQL
jgi:hypothetical protein